jgi:farnesyl-diphosphate farnesyltransferase
VSSPSPKYVHFSDARPSRATPGSLRRELLQDLLKKVSRSFYLTLHVLPAPVRDQTALAYLFARAADTIADTDLIEPTRRRTILDQFRAQFRSEEHNGQGIASIQAALLPHQTNLGEQALLVRLEDCFRLYRTFSSSDQQHIRELMGTLTNGMEMDLTVFPGEASGKVMSLATMEDLDRYVYYVAGCVGEFWTHLMCDHLGSLARWNRAEMAQIGVRFGKGLQLTNVLKDLPHDLRRGRCYIPHALLRAHGLTPDALCDPANLPRLRPVLSKLVQTAREHLDQGWLYTMAIPRREVRLRLACMWPILFAGGTLDRILKSPDVLNPNVVLKITKAEVYRVLGLTTLSAGCGYIATAYWGHLRKRLP